jgi:hypothetical protein
MIAKFKARQSWIGGSCVLPGPAADKGFFKGKKLSHNEDMFKCKRLIAAVALCVAGILIYSRND